MLVHAGGVLSDGLVTKQTPGKLRAVLAPKVNGALHLCRQAHLSPLAAMALFSSVATLLGNAGQSNYTAANGCLDAISCDLASRVSLNGADMSAAGCSGLLSTSAAQAKIAQSA